MSYLKIAICEGMMRVLSQRYRGHEFANNKRFVSSDGFTLISELYPDVRHYYDRSGTLFVCGEYIDRDNEILAIPGVKWLRDLRIAVREYNNTIKEREKHEIS